MDLSLLTMNSLMVFLLLLVRLTGMIVAAPFFSQMGVPVQLQVGIALTISFILFPLYVSTAHVVTDNLWLFTWVAAQEFIVGLLIGFLASLVFAAVQMAGNHITTQMGLGVAQAIDPITQQQSPVMGQFYFILAITLFLSLNIHHSLILAVAKSFDFIPLATGISHFNILTGRFMALGQELFMLSIVLVLPAMGILLVQEVALAFMSKIMPQMNIFMVALPLKVGVALILVYVTLPFTMEAMTTAFLSMSKQIMTLYQL